MNSLILDNYSVVYQSHSEEEPRIFLIGELHNLDECIHLNTRLIESHIRPGSWIVSEGCLSDEEPSSQQKANIISSFHLTPSITDQITEYRGWDAIDTRIFHNRGAGYLFAKQKGGDKIFSTYLHLKTEIDKAVHQLEADIDSYQEVRGNFANQVYVSWMLCQILMQALPDTVAKICHQYNFKLYQPFPTHLLEIVRKDSSPEAFLLSLKNWQLSLKYMLKILNDERQEFNTSIETEMPLRTQAMCTTLQKIDALYREGQIEGNVFLFAGLKHLCEDGSSDNPAYSLRSLYDTLDQLNIPAIVLYPELIDQ